MTIDDKMKNIKNIPETPGRLVMKYGMMCLDGRCNRGEITENEKKRIIKKFYSNSDFTKKQLQKFLPDAIPKIKDWSVEGVRNYFIKYHNKHAKQTSCRVEIYSVIKEECVDDLYITFVNHGKKEVKFINKYCLPLKKGDKVITHLGMIIEILPKTYK